MKITRFFSIGAICALFFSFCANSFADDKPAYATVVHITGEARYTTDGSTWHPLVVGQVLVAGDVAETAVNGSLDLIMGAKVQKHFISDPSDVAPASDAGVRGMVSYQSAAAQNAIHMGSGTVLSIDKLTMGDTGVDAVSNTELDLRKGSILANVKKLSASSEYIVKMPNAIAGIRGSTVGFNADEDAISVIAGSAVVASVPNGGGATTTTVLVSGQTYNTLTQLISATPPATMLFLEQLLHVTITIDSGYISVVFQNDKTTIDISPKA